MKVKLESSIYFDIDLSEFHKMLRRQISRGYNGLMYRCFKWDSYQGLYTDRDSEENLSYITNDRSQKYDMRVK